MNSVTTSSMQIPLFDLQARYEPLQSEIVNAIAAVLEQMTMLRGQEREELRRLIRSSRPTFPRTH